MHTVLCADVLSRAQLDNTDNGVTGTSANSGLTRVAPKAVNEGISLLRGGEWGKLPSIHLEGGALDHYAK